jgi:hypothetical protein
LVEYQYQFALLSQLLKGNAVKIEDSGDMITRLVQTDDLQIRLLDLPNEEIIRLMCLLNEYHNSQILNMFGETELKATNFEVKEENY